MLALGWPPGNPGRNLIQRPALLFALDQVTVVHQVINQWGHHDDVPEQLRPSRISRSGLMTVEPSSWCLATTSPTPSPAPAG